MYEDLTIDCPHCSSEFVFMFDGCLDSVSNNDVEVTCDECCCKFKVSVVSEVSYSLQLED